MGSLAVALMVALVVVSYLLFKATVGASETMRFGVWNVAVAEFTSTGEQPVSKDASEEASKVFYIELDQELSNFSLRVGFFHRSLGTR